MKPKQKRKYPDNNYSIKSAKVSRELQPGVKVPASGEPAQENSSFSEYLRKDYSVSKRRCPDEDAELNFQKGAFQSSLEKEALSHTQNVWKVSSASDGLININAQDDLTGSVVKTATSGETQKENSLFSEDLMVDCSAATCHHLDENELQSVVEAPASGHTACKYPLSPEVLMEDFFVSMHPILDVDEIQVLRRNVSCSRIPDIPVSITKGKRTKRHIGEFCGDATGGSCHFHALSVVETQSNELNLQDDALQTSQKLVVPQKTHELHKVLPPSDYFISISSEDELTGSVVEIREPGKTIGKNSLFSEGFIEDYNPSMHPHPDEDELNLLEDSLKHSRKAKALPQTQKFWEIISSDDDDLIYISSKDDLTGADAPQPESSVVVSASGQREGENPSTSEDITWDSSESKHPCLDEDAEVNLQEETLQSQKAVALTQTKKGQEISSSSNDLIYISAQDDPICAVDAAQPESGVKVTASGQMEEEYSSSLEDLTSASTQRHPDEDGFLQMPVFQDLEQSEITRLCPPATCPLHSLDKNKNHMSSMCGTEERVIYYMPVQRRRVVTILWETQEGLVRPSKKIKMEEMTYLEKVHKNVPLSHMSQKRHLTDHELSLDTRAQGKRKKADSLADLPGLNDYPRAKTPEWLVAPDCGFKCMACCRVFPSLQVLQEHVEYGVTEGFSCHVFHSAMARLNHKKCQEEKKKLKKVTHRCQKEEHFGIKITPFN